VPRWHFDWTRYIEGSYKCTVIFDELAELFIEYKREGCELPDDEIKKLCVDHKCVFLLQKVPS